jgi:DNA-binding CsgD family transcriptional regulator
MAAPVPEEPELVFPQPQRRLTAAEIVEVVRAYQRGATARELAAQFHVNRLTIAQHLKKMGIQVRGQGIRPNDIEEVAAMYAAGSSLAQVANKYGCVASTVRNTLRRHGYEVRPRRGSEG